MNAYIELSLSGMLLAHAEELSASSQPRLIEKEGRTAARKARATADRRRSAARRVERDLSEVKRHLEAGVREIENQAGIVLKLTEAGESSLLAEDLLAHYRRLQAFRQTHLINLLTQQKNGRTID